MNDTHVVPHLGYVVMKTSVGLLRVHMQVHIALNIHAVFAVH